MMLRRHSTKYTKAADRSAVVEKAQENALDDYSTYSESELKKVRNDELKAYLDARNISYPQDAIKEDYVNAILGR